MSAPWAPAGRHLDNPLLLAAGIDRDGQRAAELLALGFGGVEFGTVGIVPVSGRHAGAAALAQRLAPFAARRQRPALGINLGLAADAPDADDWLAGVPLCAPAADFLTLNLSAESAAAWRAPASAPRLWRALCGAREVRDAWAAAHGRRPTLVLKLPLDASFPPLAGLAARAGVDALLVVLPVRGALSEGADAGAFARARAGLAADCGRLPELLAVGGIRRAADVAALLAAGAFAVQVHGAFAEQGGGCVDDLLFPARTRSRDARESGDVPPSSSGRA